MIGATKTYGDSGIWNLQAAYDKPFIGGPVSTYITNDYLNSARDTYTFTGVSLGDGTGDLVLAVVARDTSTRSISSVTVAGSSATAVTSFIGDTGSDLWMQFFVVEGLTATSGTIEITWNNEVDRCGFGVWRANNVSSWAPVDSDSASESNADDVTLTLNIPANSCVFAFGSTNDQGGVPSYITFGGTDVTDFTHEMNTSDYNAGAHLDYSSAATGESIVLVTNNSDKVVFQAFVVQ